MFKTTEIGRTFAAIVCTIVLSATCVIGAVGPAQADGVHAAARVFSTVA